MVIVAEAFTPEVEQTLRYLRTRMGVDITGLQFGVHKAGGETIIETNVVIGRERTAAASLKSPNAGEPEPHETIMARVRSDFVRAAVTAIEEWVSSLNSPELRVEHGRFSNHYLRLRGQRQFEYDFATRWVTCFISAPSRAELERLRELSKPDQVREFPTYARFHLANEADLQVLKSLVVDRLNSSTTVS